MKQVLSALAAFVACLLPAAGEPGFAEWLKQDAAARQQFKDGRPAPDKATPAVSPVAGEQARTRGAETSPVSQDGRPGWLVMVYMAADNNLDPYALEDVIEMQKIGSADTLKITVLMDRVDYGDWTEARRFLVTRPSTQGGKASWDPLLPTCESVGEPNMGDPGVLSDFVRWSIAKYPLLFVMDACYAGAAGDGGKGVLREGMKAIGLNDDYLNALTGSRGTVVPTASRAGEVTMESPEYGMGVFTHYLCEALRTGDADGDGLISVMDLYQHLDRHVPSAARKLARRSIRC